MLLFGGGAAAASIWPRVVRRDTPGDGMDDDEFAWPGESFGAAEPVRLMREARLAIGTGQAERGEGGARSRDHDAAD